MGSISGEESYKPQSNDNGLNANEEKIFVAIRLRPLNERELSKHDVSDWECTNNTTVLFKDNHNVGERSLLPTTYQFDRVFGWDSSTRQVYEEAAKNIALTVLTGFNSSIFAYGQTSSGKTYTMNGITQLAMADIFDYINNKHEERRFTLKFSALEIYNESVRDLLSLDTTPLRLLDDPEKGTVVERLTEVTVRDWRHIIELLSICEAQRRIGETSMNEMSSRSHQILRLTVESCANQPFRSQNNSILSASVDFVDLAGSERSSQTLTANTRIKEGSHINRSLLALGTCIRKLSKGRNGHIPYRDSKLTRILQNSLGGNARTAIICTMSPAHSQAEQSRNTLMFATCAKQVSTNAHVNMVMTDKALVRQLQSEVERLETEVRNLAAYTSPAMKEKEALIEKMDKEIRELMRQRDTAQTWIQDLLHSRPWAEMSEASETPDYQSASDPSEMVGSFISDITSGISHFTDSFDDSFDELPDDLFLSGSTSPSIYIDKYFGPDPCKGWENTGHEHHQSFDDNWKEVQCIETDPNTRTMGSYEASPPEEGHQKCVEAMPLSPRDETDNVNVEATNEPKEDFNGRQEECSRRQEERDETTQLMGATTASQPCFATLLNEESKTMLEKKLCSSTKDAKPNSEKQLYQLLYEAEEIHKEFFAQVAGEGLAIATGSHQTPSYGSIEFEMKMKEVIELWDECYAPLVHRTYFFLLFKGDPTDLVYMEVELRRLYFLKNRWSQGAEVVTDGQVLTKPDSIKTLKQERKMLSRQLRKKLGRKEREALFQKWGIDVKTYHRRRQLSEMLWKDTKDMEHIQESAGLVAKLVGLVEPSAAPKEMFGLSFALQPKKPRKTLLSYGTSWLYGSKE
ncbi:kinesin-like protein KIN-7H isoform X1 [Ipomoea triloba]|uniref:kinesin-like protein KIN-7H isoform X1 n=2 Tax=Ipomoea triloba TaxID=35885 RepID=UPI00125CFF63|nr:kinesin-like protein KIN-7H isoform X1 [Ipomoea triloba]XP_031120020.1 kinesin-like protein KIN-7H isoform X1 [Ipomoea triloba]